MLRKAMKVHVYVQSFSLFFQAREDLLEYYTSIYTRPNPTLTTP